MFAFGLNLSAQTPTTFTTTNLKVMDTLTSVNVVNAHEIVASKTITAEKDIVVKKDVLVNGALTVTNTATFKNIINADQGLNFGNNIGLKFLGTNSSNQSFLQIGKIPSTSLAIPANPVCPSSQTNQYWLQNYGGYISNAINGNVNASLSLFTADWNGSGYIETSGTDQNNQTINALFLNYFCGRDIGLCLNTTLANGGGKVKVGNFLSAMRHVEIGDSTYGITTANSAINNIALEMHVNNGKAIKARTWNGSLSMFEIENYSNSGNLTTCKITGNGNAYFGAKKLQSSHVHANAEYQFWGKIACKELVVVDPTKWADFVFSNDYKLMPLSEVEQFYKTNKHLPDVPSEKEVKEKGINTAGMDATLLQKIEELYLHVVEQEKRIKQLEIENTELKQKIK